MNRSVLLKRMSLILVALAAHLLPRSIRREHVDVWTDHLLLEETRWQLFRSAVSISFGAVPRLAIRQWAPRAAAEFFMTMFIAFTFSAGIVRGSETTWKIPVRLALSVSIMPVQIVLVFIRRPLPPLCAQTVGAALLGLNIIPGPWRSVLGWEGYGVFGLCILVTAFIRVTARFDSTWAVQNMSTSRLRSLLALLEH